ncbi:MAG TPA: hypothetical protein VJC13_02930 [Candidatus Paceibacterota bacterium]|nr:hypothetical protein [uncultured archaeon]
MEPKFQTSFIPKKPIGSTVSPSSNISAGGSLFSSIATVVFVITLLTSGALFVYKNILSGQVEQYDKEINDASNAIQPQKIQDLIDANSRVTVTKTLLDNHVVVSKLLTLLNDLTIKRIRFTSLNYINKNKESSLSISLEAQTYNALVQEQSLLQSNEFIKNPVFSNFSLGDNGFITVDFSATVDPSLVSYKKSVELSQ